MQIILLKKGWCLPEKVLCWHRLAIVAATWSNPTDLFGHLDHHHEVLYNKWKSQIWMPSKAPNYFGCPWRCYTTRERLQMIQIQKGLHIKKSFFILFWSYFLFYADTLPLQNHPDLNSIQSKKRLWMPLPVLHHMRKVSKDLSQVMTEKI